MNTQFRDWKLSTNEREKYQLYLASREWAEKKELVKSRSRGTCERCHYRAGEQVHHLTYANKYQEPLKDLMHLCEPCHEFLSAKSNRDPKLSAPPYLNRWNGGVLVKSVYLAGKITNDHWRDELVDGYSVENKGIIDKAWEQKNATPGDWQTVFQVLPLPGGRRLNLTGPFWRPPGGSWGHGGQSDSLGDHCCGFIGKHGEEENDSYYLLGNIKSAINESDLIFAWIDKFDCYGTLVEIGYAHAMGKFIAVARPEFLNGGSDELWMASNLADRCIEAPSPREAWEILWKDA
jgi:hypothetical protein